MRMKIMSMSVIVMLMVGAAAAAQGARDTYQIQESSPVQEDGSVVMQGREYRGTLALEDSRVVLHTEREVYDLHLHPMHYALGIEIAPEEQVTLFGYELPSAMFDDGRSHIMVSRAVIGDETYVLGIAADQGRLVVPEDQLFRMIPALGSRGRWGEDEGAFGMAGMHAVRGIGTPFYCADEVSLFQRFSWSRGRGTQDADQQYHHRRGSSDVQEPAWRQPREMAPRGRQGR